MSFRNRRSVLLLRSILDGCCLSYDDAFLMMRCWCVALDHQLLFTTPGKIALAICAAIILFALTQIMKLSKPIEYGGDSV